MDRLAESSSGPVPAPDSDAAVLLWDKPAGVTSHDVVEQIRKETGMKTGHAGTLDPFATGLLVILLGRATRLQRYLLELPKRYLATARLGWISSTGDPDGELVETGRIPTRLDIPPGTFSQQVPMTSAVKVGGERLYRKAHRGEFTEDRPRREVTVHESRLLETTTGAGGGPVKARFELLVSSGTYVRNLVADLGDAYCEELRRDRVGHLDLSDAGSLLDPGEALSFMPAIMLDQPMRESFANGMRVPVGDVAPEGSVVRLLGDDGLVGVGRLADGRARPEVVIRPASG